MAEQPYRVVSHVTHGECDPDGTVTRTIQGYEAGDDITLDTPYAEPLLESGAIMVLGREGREKEPDPRKGARFDRTEESMEGREDELGPPTVRVGQEDQGLTQTRGATGDDTLVDARGPVHGEHQKVAEVTEEGAKDEEGKLIQAKHMGRKAGPGSGR